MVGPQELPTSASRQAPVIAGMQDCFPFGKTSHLVAKQNGYDNRAMPPGPLRLPAPTHRRGAVVHGGGAAAQTD